MRLMRGQLKEVYGIAKLVACEPLGPEHRVLIRYSEGRIVRPNGPALVRLPELDAVERS
jgi:hypothetical protein